MTTTNIVFVGLGGQGVLKASDIMAEAAFRAGFDVKKSEVHGMSQRGGSVTSDVRFGERIASPMVPAGEADFVVAFDEAESRRTAPLLKPGGVLVGPADVAGVNLPSSRSLNVALLGALSARLGCIGEQHWLAALAEAFSGEVLAKNREAFDAARRSACLRVAEGRDDA